MWESTWDILGRPKPKPCPASPGITTNSVMLRQPDAHQEVPASTLPEALVAGFKHCLSLFQPQKTAMLPLHYSPTNPPPHNNEDTQTSYYNKWSKTLGSSMRMVNRRRRSIVPTDIEQAEAKSPDERQSFEITEGSSAQEEDVSPKPDHSPVELMGVGSWRHQPHHGDTSSSFLRAGNNNDKEQQGKGQRSPYPNLYINSNNFG